MDFKTKGKGKGEEEREEVREGRGEKHWAGETVIKRGGRENGKKKRIRENNKDGGETEE